MATQEKLLKSLESLKNLINSNITLDLSSNKKKEKIQHCNVITEAMANPTIRIAPNFNYLLSFSIEVLLQLCDDPESDVRMIVDECLNRLIRVTGDSNMSKIQIELHKEIKTNGNSRSLRAALWRFSELAHHIRPYKGKPYVANLMPCIIKISERNEDMVHETLAASFPKIMKALGCFTTDNDIKMLLRAFLNNIPSNSAVIRRTTTTCILATCLNCRKPYVFITYILNNLLDMLFPLQDGHSLYLILGVMGCLKMILPHIKNPNGDQEIKDSFGVRKEVNETPVAVDRLLQVYEFCLHYILDSSDHNVINASLETLNILLQNSSSDLKSVLLSPEGLNKSRIAFAYDSGGKLKQRSPSQLSVATTSVSGGAEDSLETDLMDSLRPDIEKWIDESKLSVLNITYAKTTESLDRTSVQTDEGLGEGVGQAASDYSNISMGTITVEDGTESISCDKSIADNLDKLVLSETSSEKSFTQHTDDRSTITDVVYQEIDIGDIRDKDVPLIYCARLITKSFLLSGCSDTLTSDKSVRVSVKSLSLNCLSTIFQLYPRAFLRYLDKSYSNKSKDKRGQQISDVLLYKDHVDPQLRGNVRILIGNFLKAVLINSGGDYDGWLMANACSDDLERASLRNLVGIVIKGLEDESSNCSRQSLLCLNLCFKYMLESHCSLEALPIFDVLPLLGKNPYWLVKATLVDVISDIHYVTVYHITESCQFQDKIIYNIFFELLKDDNQKLRAACSSGLVKVLPLLYFKHHIPNESTVTNKAKFYKNRFLSTMNFKSEIEMNLNKKQIFTNTPFPYNQLGKMPDDIVEEALSRIVSKLVNFLLTSKSKHFIFGCVETLCLMTETYPPTVYFDAWNCFKSFNKVEEEEGKPSISSAMGLFSICIGLLCSSGVAYDINCHLNLLKLAGNLFAGISIQNLKPKPDVTLEDTTLLWDMFTDKTFSSLTEQFFNHILKMLNIFHHVLEDLTPMQPQSKPILPNLPTPANLSPIKRRKSDISEKSKIISPGKSLDKDDKAEKKSEGIKSNLVGFFANVAHYLKVYDILRTAYTNYKTTLDSEASEKFVDLLKVSLQTLSQLLELATILESGRISEEILSYFRCTFNLEPSSTVVCVQQLLKSLFGTNITCNAYDFFDNFNTKTFEKHNQDLFYTSIFQEPYDEFSKYLGNFNNSGRISHDGDDVVMGYLHRKEIKKSSILPRGADKILANYIRLFEPMVIKSLKQYTITSDVKLQCRVLQLLCQLVQLKVNYCLLDSEQIFIGFVLKQFEYIEEGQIPFPEELIPRIFNFLVHLSYGKQHSKSIISVPKIIQLCDGLMASGQAPLTNCIPALDPVVEDIFLFRNKSNTSDFKELETTREVLLSMLLRLLEYHQVIDLLVFILNESKYCTDNNDKWLKWSKQVADVFLPMLKQNKITVNNNGALKAIRKLIFVLNPSVFKPLNEVLLILFDDPPYLESSLSQLNRWLAKVHTLLMVVSQTKEELLLLKILETQADFAPRSVFRNISITADPLNVTYMADFFNGISPEMIFVKFIFRTIDIVAEKCTQIDCLEEHCFVIEQFSEFLMFCLHILQSGSHCKIANTAVELASSEFETDDELPLENINKNLLKLATFYPTLMFEWCYLLTLLNYNNREFWSDVIQITSSYGIINQLNDAPLQQKSHCINLEIVRFGGTIVFCDYLNENMNDGEQLSWFLVSNIELLVRLCNEEPVYEFLSSLHRNSSASGLVIQAIKTKCLPLTVSDPTFKAKTLKSIENVHPTQVGSLLSLLLPKLLNSRELALSRMVANLASRKIELLLMMSMEEVSSQLSKEDLIRIMDLLIETKLVKKHEALVSLLNKLATQYYDLSPLEFDQRRTVNPEYIKKLQINKVWYISQVKTKSRGCDCIGAELAELLSYLDYGDLLSIVSNSDFNKTILKDCIAWGVDTLLEENLVEESCLLKASVNVLVKDVANFHSLLPRQLHVYKINGRQETVQESKYSSRLTELFSDELFWSCLYDLIPSVICYTESLPHLTNLNVPNNNLEDFVRFSVTCLESVTFLITTRDNLSISCVDVAVSCAHVTLKNIHLSNILNNDSHTFWVCSSINSIYKLVSYFLKGSEPLPDIPKYALDGCDSYETLPARHACYQLSILIVWLEKTQNACVNIPKFLFNSIKSIIVSLSRLRLVNSYLLTPPSAWKNGFGAKLFGTFNTQVPPLPVEFLQDVEILEEFIFRITLLGWTSRQQFEETWMCLLSVLSSSPSEENIPEEVNAIIHVTSLAVQAITSLLLQTLCSPTMGNRDASQFLHVSRDLRIEDSSASIKKLRRLQNKLQYKFNSHSKMMRNDSCLTNVFSKNNLEKLNSEYSLGQLSVEYLLISAKSVENVDEMRVAAQVYAKRQMILEESGLDLNSCLQFLIDLYSQWIKTQNTPLRILYEVVKSILVISDLFTEKSQFVWMLEVYLDLSKSHTSEDGIIQQYLVIGACKAAAVLTPVSLTVRDVLAAKATSLIRIFVQDLETYETVKKLIVQNLKSGFLPSKIAGLHGILYLMQGNVLGNTCIGGLSEEMQLLFPVAIDYIQCHINSNNGVVNQSLEHSLLVWSIGFYLIENIESTNFSPEFIPSLIQAAISFVMTQKIPSACNAVLKGLERLVIKKSIPKKLCDQLVKLSLERMKSGHPIVAIPAVQMLLTYIYIDSEEQLESSNKSGGFAQSNPDTLVQTIEKISAIFDRIKRSFPFEVEILCSVLPDILNDFFPPSDILTKVLGEFLSPQQPHPKLLSHVVFKVFQSAIEQNQLSLLQDWVVFSLSNFTQSFSIGMATWCLTCFFISASTNEWLRSLFPYVQSRVGRYEYEDRKVLCIAGADFYKNLTNGKQKETFVATFSKVKDQMDTPFNELLASL